MEFVATGHYARVSRRREAIEDCIVLWIGERIKVISYTAWIPIGSPGLMFPVGHMQKSEVWQEAEGLGLPADELKESQEICFVSHGDYRTFIEQEAPGGEDGRRICR